MIDRLIRFVCRQCGRLAIEARLPERADEAKYAPVECGKCKGRTFTRHEVKA